ncbi:hypothetical protein SeMB42_g04506 [Synchytrium endobioticum]|uniref:F-box domain-containing protein n=1 Tax=Synchytrium endobioticum TaxID=286115 RepID=A0A507CXR5_9FUNG|nr:hypothetical protein SeMB42_g04506 [Synchytrium endobioticum]
MDSIHILPNELLTKIIQRLPPELLYSTLPLLDKRFHGICRDIVVGVRLHVIVESDVPDVKVYLHESTADPFLTSLQPSESSGETPLYEELVKLLHIRHLELFTHNVEFRRGYATTAMAMATLRKCIETLPHVEHSSVKLGLSACEALPQEKIKDLQLDVYGFRESNLRNVRLFQNLERLMLHQDEPANVLTDWSWIIGPRLNELVLSSSCIIDADDLLSLLGERPNLTVLEALNGLVITHHVDVDCSLRSLGIVKSPSAELYSSRILAKVVDLQIRVRTIDELQRLSMCRFSPHLQHLTVYTQVPAQEWRDFYPLWTEVARNLCASGHNIKSLEILASRIPAADIAAAQYILKEAIAAVGPSELLRNITVDEWSDFNDEFYNFDNDELSFHDGYDDFDGFDHDEYSYDDLYEDYDGINDDEHSYEVRYEDDDADYELELF